jgi:hypothetical protein
MKRIVLAISFVSSLALALVAGCGSSSGGGSGGSAGSGGSGGGGGGDVNCTNTVAGTSYCYSYSGLPSDLTSSICGTGKEASSCPTANESGCCEDIKVSAGTVSYSYGYCLYSVPSADLSAESSACGTLKGKWTAK